MSAPPRSVDSPSRLSALPDGTIVTWNLVAGDPTSAAIGYVRHEGDVTWISSGLAAPVSPDEIEGWPVTVVSMGPTDRLRERALELAALWTASSPGLHYHLDQKRGIEIVTWTADRFHEYLTGPR